MSRGKVFVAKTHRYIDSAEKRTSPRLPPGTLQAIEVRRRAWGWVNKKRFQNSTTTLDGRKPLKSLQVLKSALGGSGRSLSE